MYILEMNKYNLNLNDGRKDTTRVCIGKKLFSDWGDQGTLAFNAAIILNFDSTSPAKPFPKIQNCGGNECQITLGISITPITERNFLPVQTLVYINTKKQQPHVSSSKHQKNKDTLGALK